MRVPYEGMRMDEGTIRGMRMDEVPYRGMRVDKGWGHVDG